MMKALNESNRKIKFTKKIIRGNGGIEEKLSVVRFKGDSRVGQNQIGTFWSLLKDDGRR